MRLYGFGNRHLRPHGSIKFALAFKYRCLAPSGGSIPSLIEACKCETLPRPERNLDSVL